MKTLYLDRNNLALEVQSQALIIRENGSIKQSIPLKLLGKIVITANTEISTSCILNLATAKISLILLGAKANQAGAQLINTQQGDVLRRLNQYQLEQNSDLKLQLAKLIIRKKLQAQRKLVQKIHTTRPGLSLPCTKTLNQISETLPKLAKAQNLEQLIGFEGSVAASYFSTYTQAFSQKLNFNKRVKRPPTDPVNACLSLGYTILHHEAVRTLVGAGLEVYLGIIHQPAYNRESLASDFIEPLRAEIDLLVWRLFAEKTLREHHFSRETNNAVFLTKDGRAIFYPAYEQIAPKLRKMLKTYSYKYIKALQNMELS